MRERNSDGKGCLPKKTTTATTSSDVGDNQSRSPWRYSISSSILPSSEHLLLSKLQKLEDNLKSTRKDNAVLRQDATDLKDQLKTCLEELTDRTRKLGQAALEAEGKITTLRSMKKRVLSDLLRIKGSVQVFCLAKPFAENEDPVVEFPNEYTVRVSTSNESLINSKKDFELDWVCGPDVGQSEVFTGLQPYVQYALDGYNVSVFSYGPTHSGKTYTLEGSSHDRGLYARCFEELFSLSNLESTTASWFSFSVTVLELYNEQVKDLLEASGKSLQKVCMGSPGSLIQCVSEKVDNVQEFSRVLKTALQSRGPDALKRNVSHLIVTIHIYNNAIPGENSCSKLSLVDLAGSESECLEASVRSARHVEKLFQPIKSLLALSDVLSSVTLKKSDVPYDHSLLTKLLADSIGGSSKTVMIVNICPDVSNVNETLLSLNYSSRARSAALSFGESGSVKKWRDIVSPLCLEQHCQLIRLSLLLVVYEFCDLLYYFLVTFSLTKFL